jgi:hypothetical protein
MKPGIYPLVFALSNEGNEVTCFEVRLEILPFVFPEKCDYAWGLYEMTLMNDEYLVRDMADHGVNSLSTWPSVIPAKGEDFREWDASFEMLKRHGIDHSFFWYMGTMDFGYPVGKALGSDGVIRALKNIEKRVLDGRYPRNFYVSIDEAVCNADRFSDMKGLFAQVQENAPRLKRLGVSLNRFDFTKKYDGLIDALSCNGSFEENGSWCKERGIPMFTYTVISGRSTADSARYNAGFNPWRYGASGTYGWSLRSYSEHPYNDLDSDKSDWGIILPNWSGRPIATPGWEGYREGVDDRRYIECYQQLVAQGKASGKLLEDLRSSLVEAAKSKEDKIGDSVFESLVGDAMKLERARNMLIDAILKARG